jgi:gas vesicle protein
MGDAVDDTGFENTSGLLNPGVGGVGIGGSPAYAGSDMSAYPGTMPDDMYGSDDSGPTPEAELEQTRAQIEQTRSEMSTTIDAIQEKLSPGNIAQQAKDTVKEATVGKAQEMVSNAGSGAKGFGSGLVETVKANPVPAAIAGIGLGWLFMSGRKQNSGSDSYSSGYPAGYNPGRRGQYVDYGSSYGTTNYSGSGQYGSQNTGTNFGSQAQNSVSSVASGVQDTASQVVSNVQDTASQVASNVQDQAGQLADTAQYGAQRAQTAFQQSLNSNPLGVGVVALALGAAIGLSIPESDKENQLFGDTRDTVVQQAQQTMQEKAQQVQTVAQQAVGAAKDAASDAAQDQGLTS